jgi:ABC-type antimicrobial peptide transport system permease subunit
VRSITLQGLTVAGIGVVVGLPLAWAMIRAIGASLSDVAPVHGATLGGLLALLLGVAAVASYLPALRASRIQPAEVLQSE